MGNLGLSQPDLIYGGYAAVEARVGYGGGDFGGRKSKQTDDLTIDKIFSGTRVQLEINF